MTTPDPSEGLRLVRAFYNIGHAPIRRRIVKGTEHLATGDIEEHPPPQQPQQQDPQSLRSNWFVTYGLGFAVAALTTVFGLVSKTIWDQTTIEARDVKAAIASLTQAEKDHNDEDVRDRQLIQDQIDRRFKQEEDQLKDRISIALASADALAAKADRIKDETTSANAAVAANRSEIEAVRQSVIGLKQQFDQGRGERMSSDTAIGQRIDVNETNRNRHDDDLTKTLQEIQRQLSKAEAEILQLQQAQGPDLRPLGRPAR